MTVMFPAMSKTRLSFNCATGMPGNTHDIVWKVEVMIRKGSENTLELNAYVKVTDKRLEMTEKPLPCITTLVPPSTLTTEGVIDVTRKASSVTTPGATKAEK